MNFLNQNLDIFKKGNFEKIDRNFLTEGFENLKPLMEIQKKYNKLDSDTFFNELRDSMVATYLDFELVNSQKHGFDAKKSQNENIFLEIKEASLSANSWQGTFNDTNLEKAQAFKDKKVFLAVGLWGGLADLKFIVYGQNPLIGKYLEERILNKKENSRSTQSITIKNLITKYDFKIITPFYQKIKHSNDLYRSAIQYTIKKF